MLLKEEMWDPDVDGGLTPILEAVLSRSVQEAFKPYVPS
jgi:hypothetical protein